jgi:hypothetical protein
MSDTRLARTVINHDKHNSNPKELVPGDPMGPSLGPDL